MTQGQSETTLARPFDPHRRAASVPLKELVQEVLQQMDGYEDFHQTRKRKRTSTAQATYEATVEAVICDLIHRQLEIEGGQVHVSQSHQVLHKKSRYKGKALGKTLPGILRAMAAEEMAFLIITPGHSKFTIKDETLAISVSGQQTVLAAGEKLLSRIERFGITFADFGRSPEEEVIVLRAVKPNSVTPGKLVEYTDTDETNTLRQQMQAINAGLEVAEIGGSVPGINTHDRRLRRIFNNADFAQGGRLYGGFWQGMKHAQRLDTIALDGDSIAELDYGQMGLLLLYGIEGAG